ncbi:hypothetical protein [Undibacterium curvum]|jgi:hypothetical protein|uniref:Uncharacterized protein n=1 Tax=Undibacterium curvum TaxID=2762294 RepID=A0ABR7A2T0_9BURK|nr:hypothetical protein [Undibacterium curvum]MBC3931215.1 hypothetical protein [Undibacterium curvum]
MFAWFNAKESKQFGVSLAEFYLERVLVEGKSSGKKNVGMKQAELLIKLQAQLRTFTTKHPLNLYKKAALSNAFQWKLKDAGLESEQVDQLVTWLTRQL